MTPNPGHGSGKSRDPISTYAHSPVQLIIVRGRLLQHSDATLTPTVVACQSGEGDAAR